MDSEGAAFFKRRFNQLLKPAVHEALRAEAGSMGELAKAIGVPLSTLSGWHTGRHMPDTRGRVQQLEALLRAKGADLREGELVELWDGWWQRLTATALPAETVGGGTVTVARRVQTAPAPGSRSVVLWLRIVAGLSIALGLFLTAALWHSGLGPDRKGTGRSAMDEPSLAAGSLPTDRPHGDVTIQVRRPDGRSGPLSREVRLVGHIRGISMPCFWGGWRVHAAGGWTGYYLKRQLRPEVGGSFDVAGLQMGSPGETGSVWYPFVVGATRDACAFLERNLEETGIGQYKGASWPPPDVKVLYQGAPVHRSR